MLDNDDGMVDDGMTQDENGMVDNTMDGAEYSGEEDTTNVIGGATMVMQNRADTQEAGSADDGGGAAVILELENICKEYMQGKIPVPVLKNINFSMEEGEYVAIDGSFRLPEKQH